MSIIPLRYTPRLCIFAQNIYFSNVQIVNLVFYVHFLSGALTKQCALMKYFFIEGKIKNKIVIFN